MGTETAVDETTVMALVETEGILMLSAFMFLSEAAGTAIPIESRSFIVVSLTLTSTGPMGLGIGKESPRVIPSGLGKGTSVQCMQMSVALNLATVVFPTGGMVMLNGPKSAVGTLMQKLPPSIAN